jgi:hypothetical protein
MEGTTDRAVSTGNSGGGVPIVGKQYRSERSFDPRIRLGSNPETGASRRILGTQWPGRLRQRA